MFSRIDRQTWGTIIARDVPCDQHLESRCRPDWVAGGCEPYLAFAGCIGAGLWALTRFVAASAGTGNCYNADGVYRRRGRWRRPARELANSTTAREASSRIWIILIA